MALSQLQCLDANHVNPRTNESKPEFLYCEDQRLALEALLRDGREAFSKYLDSRGLRGFLSEPEQESLRALAEPFEPDSELSPEKPEESDPPLSLHYWPDLSDTSTPEMDLGWPDSAGYRGVTRTTVYCQPPIDGQAHIKEVVRKMIAQAQKVIAVVMDMFTDVDIFRDLLDVSFKKRVSVYILLERTALPHFLSMCQRANMHTGHLKNLRIRCSGGSEFYTRSSTRVRGRLGHRFMFIDGHKAVSGSYSFTWMSSRLDRNLVTVVTGQAVETFDKLFRLLYATSSSVDLHALEPEPEPEKEALPQSAVVTPLSAAIAMKLYSPKYNLAISTISSPPLPANHDSTKKSTSGETSKNPEDQKKKRRKRARKEPLQEPPPLHPYLSSLEKVCLISFLPTWPEPDPPSDVIGFINIRDSSKPLQAHLQRSEMFETSQAIRFSSPISIPKEDLPLVAKPRKLVAEQAEVKKLSQSQTPAGDLKRKLENKTLASETQHKSARNTECEPSAKTKESGRNISNAAPRNSDKPNASSSCEGRRLSTPQNPSIPPGSHAKACERNVVVNGFTGMQASPLTGWPIGSGTGQQAQATETSPDLQTSSSSSPIHAPLSSVTSPLAPSSPNHGPPPRSESSSPPTPKPRTVQLIIKDTVHDDGHKLQKVSIVRREQGDRGLQAQEQPSPVRHSWTANESLRDIWTVNESLRQQDGVECVREGKFGEAQNKNVALNYQETKIEEVVHDVKERTESQHQSKTGGVTAGAAETVDDQEDNVREDDQSDRVVTTPSGNTRAGPAGSQSDEVTHENRKNLVKHKANVPGGHTLQDTPTDGISSVLETSSHTPEDETGNPNTLADGCASRAKGGALNGLSSSPELSPKSPASRSPSEVSLSSDQHDTQQKDLRLRTPDREPSERPLSPLGRSPSTPTPDPRSHTPGGSSRASGFRTPTPDLSDGFGSPRALSSTTSDEYFECSDLPCCEAFENVDSSGCGVRELDSRTSHANTANTTEEDTSESRVGSADCKAIQVEDKKNTHLDMETRGEPKAQRRDGKEAESSVNNFTHTHGNLTEAASQEGNRKISKSQTERLDERRVTRKRTDSEPASTGGTQREKLTARNEHASISSSSPLFNHRAMKPKEKRKEREWPRFEMKLREGKKAQRRGAEEFKSVAEAFNHGNTLTEVASPREAGRAIPPKAEKPDEGAATGKTTESETSSTGDAQKERKTARDNSRETEEDKMSHTPPQQDRGAASAPPQTIQAKSGTLPDVLPVPGNTENPPRSSKPVPPSAEARKQRAKARQWPNRNSAPKSQNAHAQPIAVEPHPDSQKPAFPAEETQRQVDRKIPFNLTFSHLYSLKDKINKRPAQSKRGSSSSAAQTPKS